MDKHYFTVEEANRMIPFLEVAFSAMLQMRMQIQAAYQRLDRVGLAPEEDDFEVPLEDAPAHAIQDLAVLRGLIDAVRDQLERVQQTGCVVKGIEPALVDWWSRKDGRDVFLCWRLGEKQVEAWHEVDTGFAGRRPLAELFDDDAGQS
jgi:hypothetical protein